MSLIFDRDLLEPPTIVFELKDQNPAKVNNYNEAISSISNGKAATYIKSINNHLTITLADGNTYAVFDISRHIDVFRNIQVTCSESKEPLESYLTINNTVISKNLNTNTGKLAEDWFPACVCIYWPIFVYVKINSGMNCSLTYEGMLLPSPERESLLKPTAPLWIPKYQIIYSGKDLILQKRKKPIKIYDVPSNNSITVSEIIRKFDFKLLGRIEMNSNNISLRDIGDAISNVVVRVSSRTRVIVKLNDITFVDIYVEDDSKIISHPILFAPFTNITLFSENAEKVLVSWDVYQSEDYGFILDHYQNIIDEDNNLVIREGQQFKRESLDLDDKKENVDRRLDITS